MFAPKSRLSEIEGFEIEFGGSVIQAASYVKNLGTFFDKTLSMEKQCNSISRSCYMHVRNIGCIRPYISEDACKILVNSLVTSRLDYGNALLYGINKAFIKKLQRVQNTAARLVTMTKKSEHITPVLAHLHWLPVEFRIQYKLLLYVHKSLNGLSPVYLKELIKLYAPSRSLRSESALQLEVPRTRTKTYGERRFDKAAAVLWNNIPDCLRKADSILTFKKSLKTHLFIHAYDM